MPDDRCVTADLHQDPERLALLARRTTELLDALVPLPDLDPAVRHALAGLPGGPHLLDSLDALRGSAGRAGREIGELAAHLDSAAAAATMAECATGDAVGRLADRL